MKKLLATFILCAGIGSCAVAHACGDVKNQNKSTKYKPKALYIHTLRSTL